MTGAPIGMFDSGVGGLSIYVETRHALPGHDIIYVADQGYGMYGERSLAEVRQRSETVARFLIDRGATTIVVACNSASAAALHPLRAQFPGVTFVGMEPAVKPAAGVSRTGKIGVLATETTFQGELFASVVDRHAANHEVITKTCPGLAAAIEAGDPGTDELIERYVGDVVARGADVVVLGCTHYSLVKDRIAAAADTATVVDPAPAVARQVARVVDNPHRSSHGSVTFLTTADPDRFSGQLRELLGLAASPGRVEL
ncbi:MAG: glutamate racemase [Acidimicrobiia bacterium]|nr:MAG: glutamate racemase [Acidimicrobiia bacterium]